MRGMRNRITLGYFGIKLDRVGATAQTALPKLPGSLSTTRDGTNDTLRVADMART